MLTDCSQVLKEEWLFYPLYSYSEKATVTIWIALVFIFSVQNCLLFVYVQFSDFSWYLFDSPEIIVFSFTLCHNYCIITVPCLHKPDYFI